MQRRNVVPLRDIIRVSGNEDYLRLCTFIAQTARQFEPVHPGHFYIQKQNVVDVVCVHIEQKRFRRRKNAYFRAVRGSFRPGVNSRFQRFRLTLIVVAYGNTHFYHILSPLMIIA